MAPIAAAKMRIPATGPGRTYTGKYCEHDCIQMQRKPQCRHCRQVGHLDPHRDDLHRVCCRLWTSRADNPISSSLCGHETPTARRASRNSRGQRGPISPGVGMYRSGGPSSQRVDELASTMTRLGGPSSCHTVQDPCFFGNVEHVPCPRTASTRLMHCLVVVRETHPGHYPPRSLRAHISQRARR